MINSKKLSLVSHAWKLWLAEMTALVLLLWGWDAESECWGWDLFDTYFQTGKKKKKKKKCDLFSFAAACSQFSVYINSYGNSSSYCHIL